MARRLRDAAPAAKLFGRAAYICWWPYFYSGAPPHSDLGIACFMTAAFWLCLETIPQNFEVGLLLTLQIVFWFSRSAFPTTTAATVIYWVIMAGLGGVNFRFLKRRGFFQQQQVGKRTLIRRPEPIGGVQSPF